MKEDAIQSMQPLLEDVDVEKLAPTFVPPSPADKINDEANSDSLSTIRDDPAKEKINPFFIISLWIAISSGVIGTRILARYTKLLKGLADVDMTTQRYYKNIVPIGALFSASLICSNAAYLTLSVSFIQMLKAFMPVAVLAISFVFGLKEPSLVLAGIVMATSTGVATASFGEANFVMSGFIAQVLAIVFESSRLVMIQILLQGMKMDPLVSLYYFAPVCTAINAVVLLFSEAAQPFLHIDRVGIFVLVSNAALAFALNITAVYLIGSASSLVLTLSGVLKDILLIVGSLMFFGSAITPIQYVGYAVALLGLVAFKQYG